MSPEPAPQPPEPQGVRCSLEEQELSAESLMEEAEASLIKEYQAAAELLRSMLARMAQPDRALCVHLGETLSRAGLFPDAIGAFRGAALLGPLKPTELDELALGLAHSLGLHKKWLPEVARSGCAAGSSGPVAPRDLLGCPRCGRLLYKPVTLASGLTVCKRCVKLVPGRPQDERVNVMLSGLLERCFPAYCRLRRMACQARGLQRQQQPEAALLRCQQVLDMAPDDSSLLLLRAEIYLSTKNYEQAMQDADTVCQREPLMAKGHHIKAQILSELGRSKEGLMEFIYSIALNPGCKAAREGTHKVIYEVLFSASESEHENSTASTQSGPEAHCDGQMNPQCPVEEGGNANTGSPENPSEKSDAVKKEINSSVMYLIMGLNREEDKKALESVFPAAPSSTLKRQLPSDTKDGCDGNTPEKVPKKDVDSSPRGNVNSLEEPEFTIDLADFECALCMRLLFEPVTTPCGHTFCLKCLERCLDHAPYCPLCKDKLSELLATRNFHVTDLVEELILQYLPDELSDRKRIHDEEMLELSDLTRDVPIFVCAMTFPTVSCPLHVFEPNYRLMIRRCMETGTKRFGMCLSSENAGISEFGCMLEIRDIRTFPDGSSIVDAVGISRFRVLSHRHRDGYNTADIEYLEDEKVEGPEYEELTALHESVYQEVVSWLASLQDPMKTKILNLFGSMPDREPDAQSTAIGPAWSWWILAVLPLERKAQVAILGMASLKERLLAIRRILGIITQKMNSRQEMANNTQGDN